MKNHTIFRPCLLKNNKRSPFIMGKKYIVGLILILNSVIGFCNTQKADSMIMLLSKLKNTNDSIDTQNEIAWELREENKETALAYAKKAGQMAETAEYKFGQGNALLYQGIIYYLHNEFTEADKYITKATNIFKKIDNKSKIASCYYNLGCSKKLNNNFEESNLNYQKALEIFLALDNKVNASSCYSVIGRNLEHTGKYQDAIDNYKKSLELSIVLNDDSRIASNYLNIGNIYDSWGNISKANEYYLKAYNKYELVNDHEGMAFCLNNIGNANEEWGNYNLAVGYFQKALDLSIADNDTANIPGYMTNIGRVYSAWGNYEKAQYYFSEARRIAEESNNEELLVLIHNNLGDLSLKKGNFDEAIVHQKTAFDISSQITYPIGIARSLKRIGDIHERWGNDSTAINYYQKSLIVYTKLDEQSEMANLFANLGRVYNAMNNDIEAIGCFDKAMKINEKVGNPSNKASCLHELGLIYLKKNKNNEALEYLIESQLIYTSLNRNTELSGNYIAIGQVYENEKVYTKGIENYLKGLKIAKELGQKPEIEKAYLGLSKCYEKQNNIPMAFEYFKQHKAMHDSLFTIESQVRINQIESKFQLLKKEQQIKMQTQDILKNELKIKQQESLRNLLIAGISAALLVILIFIWAYIQKRRSHNLILIQKQEISEKQILLEKQKEEIMQQNKHLHQKNEEILAQRDEIEVQQQTLLKINADVKASINYAERIQRSMLPEEPRLHEYFSDFFIFFKPRDIVSGDFYWFRSVQNYIVIAAADCTGHGVPGAFMSMLGMSLLNEIINDIPIDSPDIILDKIRIKIKAALKQKGTFGEMRDGMDMALCVIDTNTHRLQFAGAHNPLYIIRNKELIHLKGDPQPLAIYERERAFTLHNFDLIPNDCIYLFTDGYADQFGGFDGKKFMSKNFKDLVLKIYNLPMKMQKLELEKSFKDWRKNMEQMDDLLIMGFRL